jgi:hypothetical protein
MFPFSHISFAVRQTEEISSLDNEEIVRSLNGRALALLDATLSREENSPHGFGRFRQTSPDSGGITSRQVLIGLMGLERLRSSGTHETPRFPKLQEFLLADSHWVRGAGDLGLLAWFTAVCAPERLGNLFNQFDFYAALERQAEAFEIDTTGIALFLAGISHARISGKAGMPDLSDAALMAYRLLQKNQGDSGIFGQSSLCWRISSLFYSRFGRLNDQMYAIYALSMFARAYRVEEPLALALSCANAICSTQGENGEWWFRYDKRTSRVAKRFPLFPLQQEGTAPLALGTLSEACNRSFHAAILKGISWSHRASRASQGMIPGQSPAQGDANRTLGCTRLDHLGWALYASETLGFSQGISQVRVRSANGL